MFRKVILALLSLCTAANAADYLKVGENSRTPGGWIQFCKDNPKECVAGPYEARDIVMTSTAWKDMSKINRWVNDTIKPITDMDHWGIIEKWSLPDDGYGDCEEYVLLKRKMLIDNGWPRSALLITVVRDKKGDGHAVLIAKTDKGEFALDNQETKILPVTETGYRYVKRQSQTDEHVWISLGNSAAPPVVSGK